MLSIYLTLCFSCWSFSTAKTLVSEISSKQRCTESMASFSDFEPIFASRSTTYFIGICLDKSDVVFMLCVAIVLFSIVWCATYLVAVSFMHADCFAQVYFWNRKTQRHCRAAGNPRQVSNCWDRKFYVSKGSCAILSTRHWTKMLGLKFFCSLTQHG